MVLLAPQHRAASNFDSPLCTTEHEKGDCTSTIHLGIWPAKVTCPEPGLGTWELQRLLWNGSLRVKESAFAYIESYKKGTDFTLQRCRKKRLSLGHDRQLLDKGSVQRGKLACLIAHCSWAQEEALSTFQHPLCYGASGRLPAYKKQHVQAKRTSSGVLPATCLVTISSFLASPNHSSVSSTSYFTIDLNCKLGGGQLETPDNISITLLVWSQPRESETAWLYSCSAASRLIMTHSLTRHLANF